MKEKIKVIIADDNKSICNILKRYLSKYEDIEILGIANTDEEELDLIERMKPQIVITDLMRNHKYTGLDIIKKYYYQKRGPEFLIISAELKKRIIPSNIQIGGYIKKPFYDYSIVVKELKKMKQNIVMKKEYVKIKNQVTILKFKSIIGLFKVKKCESM